MHLFDFGFKFAPIFDIEHELLRARVIVLKVIDHVWQRIGRWLAEEILLRRS